MSVIPDALEGERFRQSVLARAEQLRKRLNVSQFEAAALAMSEFSGAPLKVCREKLKQWQAEAAQ
jgi:hypothetical protein